MIKKILIAEDYESSNLSIQKTLEELNITNPDYVYYCDDALLRIQKAVEANASYDLLITDLHFEEDHRQQKITSGAALIAAARNIQPDLKILVFSATGKPATIEMLFNKQEIDGYVCKGRNDAKELKSAIREIDRNQRYFPRQQFLQIRQKNAHDFTPADIAIISCLAEGIDQKDIPFYLEQKQLRPSGLSSIEKRIKIMKDAFNFSKTGQLIAFCKEKGIV
ncbi:response regulator [Niabella beijingensis]|uniref:response regulator n=1 Tax=Niabella beijingensis TaxID=2872700 RepID=UPI001CBB5CC4|nr:response regulator [Niabella beijingensis]MBZ4188859.1 response regulator [Niabella beijingensis]